FAHVLRRGGDPLLVTGDRVIGLIERRLRADPRVLDLVVVGAEVDRALVLLDGPPDRNPPVTGERVPVLAQQQHGARPVRPPGPGRPASLSSWRQISASNNGLAARKSSSSPSASYRSSNSPLSARQDSASSAPCTGAPGSDYGAARR